MAYIAMAEIVMAYIGMAYMVMAYVVMTELRAWFIAKRWPMHTHVLRGSSEQRCANARGTPVVGRAFPNVLPNAGVAVEDPMHFDLGTNLWQARAACRTCRTSSASRSPAAASPRPCRRSAAHACRVYRGHGPFCCVPIPITLRFLPLAVVCRCCIWASRATCL